VFWAGFITSLGPIFAAGIVAAFARAQPNTAKLAIAVLTVVLLGGALVALLVFFVLQTRDRDPLDIRAADILGVSHRASPSTIRGAYLRLVKELHPDGRAPGAASEAAAARLRQVVSAYRVLTEATKAMERQRRSKREAAMTAVSRFRALFGRRAGAEQPISTIETPPCMRLARLAKFVFPKRTYERYLSNGLAETQREYIEALQEGDLQKAKWVRIRGVALFWWDVFKLLPIVRQVWALLGD
jgi:hypothetical protein